MPERDEDLRRVRAGRMRLQQIRVDPNLLAERAVDTEALRGLEEFYGRDGYINSKNASVPILGTSSRTSPSSAPEAKGYDQPPSPR